MKQAFIGYRMKPGSDLNIDSFVNELWFDLPLTMSIDTDLNIDSLLWDTYQPWEHQYVSSLITPVDLRQ